MDGSFNLFLGIALDGGDGTAAAVSRFKGVAATVATSTDFTVAADGTDGVAVEATDLVSTDGLQKSEH